MHTGKNTSALVQYFFFLTYCLLSSHVDFSTNYRMLVYDFVDNGNLEQWIHGDVGDVSPLTWDIRMNIILGMAKG